MNIIDNSLVLFQHNEPSDWVLSIAASPDGALLATGGLLERVYLWDMRRRVLVHTFNPEGPGEYPEGITEIAFHMSSLYFAYIEGDVTICDVRTGKWEPLTTLADADNYAATFAFDDHFPQIAVGLQNGSVFVWNIQENRKLISYEATDCLNSLSFSSDSNTLAITCFDGSCRFLSTITGKIIHELTVKEKYECGFFSPCRPLFLSVSSSGKLSAWDEKTLQLQRQRSTQVVDVSRYAVSRSTPILAVRSSDGRVIIWDYSDNTITTVIKTPSDKITPICFSSDGRSLLIGGKDRCVRLVSVQ